MRQSNTTNPSMDECIEMAILLCTDYYTNEIGEPTSFNSNSHKEDIPKVISFWFSKDQLVKLKKFVSEKQTRRVVNKDFFEEVLQIADRFLPIEAETYTWTDVWLTKKQLTHLINFCII